MNRVPAQHKGGRAFFGSTSSNILSDTDYFPCLNFLTPLFAEEDFVVSTPGFYINYIRDPSLPEGAIRLNCYSIDVTNTRKAISRFVEQNRNEIILMKFEGLDEGSGFDLVDQPEERRTKILQMRNSFDASTRIVLDLLGNIGVEETRRLFTSYISEVASSRILPRDFFESRFAEHSGFYNSLNEDDKNHFWQALLYYQREIQALGIHFPYNMLLLNQGPIHQYLTPETI